MCWERSETQLLKEQLREDERVELRPHEVEPDEAAPQRDFVPERERELVHS